MVDRFGDHAKHGSARWPRSVAHALVPCGIVLVALVYALLPSARAQEVRYPQLVRMSAVPVPPVKYPPYLVPFVDPAFNTRVTRITDLSAIPREGQAVRHHYSRAQAWNSDGSLLMVGGAFLLDGKTYKLLGRYAGVSAETFWSHVDPHILWSFDPRSQRLLRETVVTVSGDKLITTPATVRRFSKPDADPFDSDESYEFDQMLMGGYEGALSHDDRLVAFMARRKSDLVVLVYDIQQNLLIARRDFRGEWPEGKPPNLDWCSVSPTGNYVVVSWTNRAKRRGVEVYSKELTYLRTLVDLPQHGDLCVDASGNEVWVQLLLGRQKSRYGAVIGGFRLDGRTGPILMVPYGPLGSTGGHVSCANYRRRGWAYITGQTAFMEVFAIQIEDNGRVEHFAHHHSSTPAEATVNPDGTKVLFASDWGKGPSGPVYSYVAEAWSEPVERVGDSVVPPAEARVPPGRDRATPAETWMPRPTREPWAKPPSEHRRVARTMSRGDREGPLWIGAITFYY